MDTYKFKSMRAKLVESLVEKGLTNTQIQQALLAVPRHEFVESALSEKAYEDIPLPIGENQTISQPYTVAYQTLLLGVKPGKKILEIGTGSGYQCAILCEMGANVWSIERQRELYEKAKKVLNHLGYSPNLKCGDGTMGWASFQPFDGILVTAGSPKIPDSLRLQLAIDGRMVIPVGDKENQVMTVVIRKTVDEFEIQEYSTFKFVPLIGREGWNN